MFDAGDGDGLQHTPRARAPEPTPGDPNADRLDHGDDLDLDQPAPGADVEGEFVLASAVANTGREKQGKRDEVKVLVVYQVTAERDCSDDGCDVVQAHDYPEFDRLPLGLSASST